MQGSHKELVKVLQKTVPKKAVIAQPTLYQDWPTYTKAFCEQGGIIEAAPGCAQSQMASPSISFLIEPSGDIDLIGSYD